MGVMAAVAARMSVSAAIEGRVGKVRAIPDGGHRLNSVRKANKGMSKRMRDV